MVVRPLSCLPWILPDTGCLGPSAQFPGQVTLPKHFYEDFSYISTMLQCEVNQSNIYLWCHRLARVVSCCPGRKQTKIGQDSRATVTGALICPPNKAMVIYRENV